ncbi:hypothetical protein GLAREA_12745 [Glarea lozoyensis ATCC 20868]|uniref:Chromo domain-containing protein n=2 Tax=Glarea lozoyensis TaxID=101852 RepID=S3CYU8_GLAL2|nr:uncharacterized protein GLAREA_12745 [Glarea lozoyensis ATCC 20868]EHK97319.1 hypothetical protein M7I_6950 [Glarea lozoyensis 74030]EPE31442.1 hypothetical protein GLAREA_12745 [Glarea lozoyensis ATCC 20868]
MAPRRPQLEASSTSHKPVGGPDQLPVARSSHTIDGIHSQRSLHTDPDLVNVKEFLVTGSKMPLWLYLVECNIHPREPLSHGFPPLNNVSEHRWEKPATPGILARHIENHFEIEGLLENDRNQKKFRHEIQGGYRCLFLLEKHALSHIKAKEAEKKEFAKWRIYLIEGRKLSDHQAVVVDVDKAHKILSSSGLITQRLSTATTEGAYLVLGGIDAHEVSGSYPLNARRLWELGLSEVELAAIRKGIELGALNVIDMAGEPLLLDEHQEASQQTGDQDTTSAAINKLRQPFPGEIKSVIQAKRDRKNKGKYLFRVDWVGVWIPKDEWLPHANVPKEMRDPAIKEFEAKRKAENLKSNAAKKRKADGHPMAE